MRWRSRDRMSCVLPGLVANNGQGCGAAARMTDCRVADKRCGVVDLLGTGDVLLPLLVVNGAEGAF
jgi:hypothetical protein